MITAHRVEFRAVLIVLGGVQFANGAWATLAPTSFYDEFPFGRGWVAALPAYNEHLMRDVGGLFLATGFVLLAAAWAMERRLVAVALASYLLFSVPHAIYHLFNLERYASGDAVANVVALTATVLLPAWLLIRLAGETTSRPPALHAARGKAAPERLDSPSPRSYHRGEARRGGDDGSLD